MHWESILQHWLENMIKSIGVLAVFTKAPEPGIVKTRLIQAL